MIYADRIDVAAPPGWSLASMPTADDRWLRFLLASADRGSRGQPPWIVSIVLSKSWCDEHQETLDWKQLLDLEVLWQTSKDSGDAEKQYRMPHRTRQLSELERLWRME